MTKPNAIVFYDGRYAHIAACDDFGAVSEEVTCRIWPGRYVRIDDSKHYRQLMDNGPYGGTVSADRDEGRIGKSLARDIGARLYKRRAGYDRAVKRLAEVAPAWT
jgi:hypothetical protein